jgi:hypothetical protein
MNVAEQVAKWLLSFQHVAMTTPVTVKIGKHTFSGARYTEDRESTVEEGLYLVGKCPARYRRAKVCFRTADSQCDWYVASWFVMVGFSREWQDVFRFADHFSLKRWSMPPGWTIDKFEPKAYRRIPMTIMPAGPAAPDIIQPTEETNDGDDHRNGEVRGP